MVQTIVLRERPEVKQVSAIGELPSVIPEAICHLPFPQGYAVGMPDERRKERQSQDYYALLEVRPEASPQEIRAAFRRLALTVHPDHSREADAAERFRALKEAYEVLRVPERRRAYDEVRMFRGRPRSRKRKIGREALSWVENFFIQAGGIEAEGPAVGSLRRFTPEDLDAIWHTIASRLQERGNIRQTIQQFDLLFHYIGRHAELSLPEDAAERLQEKRERLEEFAQICRSGRFSWDRSTTSLEDLIRRRRYEDARGRLLWRAAHRLADRLTTTDLFQPVAGDWAPLQELSLVDRLEAVETGMESAGRSLGHGYTACRRCSGWAMAWGVGLPRCIRCGSVRFVLRPRDERDDILERLLGRRVHRFSAGENRRRRAAQLGLERWIWAPLFLTLTFLFPFVFLFAGSGALPIWLLLAGWGAWFDAAWTQGDPRMRDTDILFPDEWDIARRVFTFAGTFAGILLATAALALAMADWWGSAVLGGVLAALAFGAPSIRRSAEQR